MPLVPPRGYFPDFLTPAAGAYGFEPGLDALLSTPRGQLRGQVEKLGEGRKLTPWLRAVREGGAPPLHRLGAALRAYQDTALCTWWQRITARVESDRTMRARTQWARGTEAMLRTFEPVLRWRAPVLEAEYPVDRDIHLEGRGLLLIPSYFCRARPVALADPALPPTLVYPARSSVPRARPLTELGGAHLARLLGPTRAAVLQSLDGDCTTSELAQRAGVSLSSASEHASVLRGAGLVSSSRQRNSVRHALTPIGLALLDGHPGLAAPAEA
ncbi:helix-turn-helix domain-containing protein [Streptomyces sp. NPDC048172]|uniref:helix-turn-helix domain-containing protein n=1 Tax=Streptomyces sp. NPDC048172 TaxID=3365505 RepID=UPI00371F5433